MKDFLPRAMRAVLAGFTVSLLLAGCSSLKDAVGPPPPLQLYVLHPETAPMPEGPPLHWQLAVAVPSAPAALDTNLIALNPTPATMDYYANASWLDRAPPLLQAHMIEAFDRAKRISVTRDTSGLAPDYLLQSDIRQFQARYTQAPVPGMGATAPEIVVEIETKLISVPDQRVIGSIDIIQKAAAQTNTTEGVVAAFNQAVGAALSQIVDWTLKTPPAG